MVSEFGSFNKFIVFKPFTKKSPVIKLNHINRSIIIFAFICLAFPYFPVCFLSSIPAVELESLSLEIKHNSKIMARSIPCCRNNAFQAHDSIDAGFLTLTCD